jgi:hypothetical protein
MEAQGQGVQVAENLKRDASHCLLGDAGKENLPQFSKQGSGKAQGAIEQQQADGQGQQLLVGRHAVDHLLEYQRNAYVGELGAYQARDCQQHAATVLP